jgi:hypothetical protein
MPYKFGENRRRKILKAKYRTTNWQTYDAALVRRGSPVVLVNEEPSEPWQASATGKQGWLTDLLFDRHRDEPRSAAGLPSAAATGRAFVAIVRRHAQDGHRDPRSHHIYVDIG